MFCAASKHVEQYNKDGYLLVESLFTPEEVSLLMETAREDRQLAEHALDDGDGGKTEATFFTRPPRIRAPIPVGRLSPATQPRTTPSNAIILAITRLKRFPTREFSKRENADSMPIRYSMVKMWALMPTSRGKRDRMSDPYI